MPTQEEFVDGTVVAIAHKGGFGPFNPYGLLGTIKKSLGGERCVEVYVSRVYRPRFWFPWSRLAVRAGAEVAPLEPHLIEAALGGRHANMADKPIARGCVRSWMLEKLRVAEGHALEKLILEMDWLQLLTIYADKTNKAYNDWVEANDARPRRTRILERSGGDGFGNTLNIRRRR